MDGMTTTTVIIPTAASVENATKVYGTGDAGVRALDDVTTAIPTGRLIAIMGPSGSGKSTLLHCMAGLDTLTSGIVRIGDKDLADLDDQELTILRRERVGFVFQSFNLIPTLTARENIVLPFTLGGRTPDEQWISQIVATVGLRDRLTHRPGELSGGQQQRVAIARALGTKPAIVFADEPTGNLDSTTSAEILELMRDSVDGYGQTTVMVTHDARAAAIADRILFLADGKIVRDVGPSDAGEVIAVMEELSR